MRQNARHSCQVISSDCYQLVAFIPSFQLARFGLFKSGSDGTSCRSLTAAASFRLGLGTRLVSIPLMNHGPRWMIEDVEKGNERTACPLSSAHSFFFFPLSRPLFPSFDIFPMAHDLHSDSCKYIHFIMCLERPLMHKDRLVQTNTRHPPSG